MSLKKIIPLGKNIPIVWFIGNVCNYRCFYCKPNFHDSSQPFANDYTPFIKFVDSIKEQYPEKQITIMIQGGEVTLWSKIREFLKECKEKKYITEIITNGSKTIRWWKETIDLFDYIIVSYHTQYADENKMEKLASIIKEKGQINMMIPPKKFSECVKIARQISKRQSIPILLKYLRKNFTKELYEYTKPQLNFLYMKKGFGLQYIRNKGLSSMVTLINSDDSEEITHVSNLFLRNRINFKGWKCWGGISSFFIDFNGDIYRGQCLQGRIGNIYMDRNIKLPTEPYICTSDACKCIADLSSCRKEKINE